MHLVSSDVPVGLLIYSVDSLLENAGSEQSLLLPSGLPNMLACFLPNSLCSEAMILCEVLYKIS